MNEIEINLLEPERTKRKKQRYLFLAALTALILIAAAISGAMFFNNPSEDEATGAGIAKPSFFNQLKNLILSSDRQLKGETDDRVNILLLGMGGQGHEGAYLTDTIIVASIKPAERKLAMLSIPRDLLTNIPGFGFRRINEANALAEFKTPGAGSELAKQVVENVIGLPLHYYIRIDFEGFKKIIDELGGVEVYIDKSFTDAKFPALNYKYREISFEQGWQKMDGQTALDYARSRHGGVGEGNDFARSRRQQKILAALKDKAFSFSTFLNPGRLQNIFGDLTNHLQTDLELWEINRFYKLAKKLDYENMISRVLEAGENGPLVESQFGGASVLLPRADNYEEVQRLARNLFGPTMAAEKPLVKIPPPPGQPKIQIQNGTWTLGLAAQTKAELEAQGVAIESVENAKSRPYEKTIIYNFSQNKYLDAMNKLKTILNAELATSTPSGLAETPLPDILIIVGKDKNSSSSL